MIVDLNPDLGMLLLRLALAVVFLAHGPAKLMKTKEMAKGMGMQPNMVMMVGAAETVGALSMLLGVATDIGAILLGIVMIGAIYFKTQKWGKKFTGEGGWELDFSLLVACLAVLLSGPGAFGF